MLTKGGLHASWPLVVPRALLEPVKCQQEPYQSSWWEHLSALLPPPARPSAAPSGASGGASAWGTCAEGRPDPRQTWHESPLLR